jgi:CRISPR system Cascade subunit CasE
MRAMYFSRVTLDKTAGNAALSSLLDPADRAKAMDAHHRLLWTLFADSADRERDFLWRAGTGGTFYVLSRREPVPHPLFLPPEVKEFAPVLAAGDRVTFSLRANATKDRATISRLAKQERGGKSRRVDVVMDLLKKLPKGSDRSVERRRLAEQAALDWMTGQAGRGGFKLSALRVEDYSVVQLNRPGAGNSNSIVTLGVLDLTGEIEVTEPERFVEKLSQGFGRGKAFGFGLMLIRRA